MDYYTLQINNKAYQKRVTAGIRRAMKAGYIRKVGTRYRMGSVTKEGFDMEEIMPGEPMALLPDGKGQSDLLTMSAIRIIWLGDVLRADVAKELGVPENRIAIRWDSDRLTVSVIEEEGA